MQPINSFSVAPFLTIQAYESKIRLDDSLTQNDAGLAKAKTRNPSCRPAIKSLAARTTNPSSYPAVNPSTATVPASTASITPGQGDVSVDEPFVQFGAQLGGGSDNRASSQQLTDLKDLEDDGSLILPSGQIETLLNERGKEVKDDNGDNDDEADGQRRGELGNSGNTRSRLGDDSSHPCTVI